MTKPVYTLLFFLLLSVTGFSQASRSVLAYYTGDGTNVRQYPLQGVTHIIYSFLHLRGDSLSFSGEKQEAILRRLAELKQEFPKLKIMVALGGWGGCATCSPVFGSENGRKHFIASVVDILKRFNADGLDIDWEYPTIEGYPGHAYGPADKENLNLLLKGLRKAFGKKYELSFAAGGFEKFVTDAVDWKTAMKYVDRVNLMTYDLVSGFSTQTGHHTPLYSNPDQKESTDHCVQLLKQRGVPAKKLVIGAAFYARTWRNVPDQRDGIYQPGVFTSFIAYRDHARIFADSAGFKAFFDEKSRANWFFNAKTGIFGTGDNLQSVREKSRYVKEQGLGGIMFWELSLDVPSGGLLDAIIDEIGSHK